MSSFRCKICGSEYNYRKSLRRHVWQAHPDQLNQIVPSLYKKEHSSMYQCYLCDKNFSQKSALNRHQREIHEMEVHGVMLKCTLCSFESSSKKCWLDHFQSAHDIHVSVEELQFTTENDFMQWKETMESTTQSRFIRRYSKETSAGIFGHYFVCNRSGYFNSKSKGIRHIKLKGSNKMNGKCPAEINVYVQEDGTWKVNFVATHIGHKQELGHLQLSQKDRETIAADIALGIPYRDVLSKIRETLHHSNFERIHATTMQDIRNIAASYNLSSKSVRHQNDAVSVESWVQEVRESENPCVLYYKPQESVCEIHPTVREEDFVLIIMNSAQRELLSKYGSDCICVDGTHGLNGYDFEVTTLLVLDDLRQGFPCAFMISNRNDCEMLSVFFHYVKSQVGDIRPKVFMTDMAESYILAWNRIMGAPEMRLFCSWHVDKAWRNNIKAKIAHKDKQIEVYKIVKSLMLVTNVSLFEESLQKVIEKLCADPETLDFGLYFKNNYEKNTKSWAYCYRLTAGLNTNMHLESMHKDLKHYHGNAKQVKRLDKGISALLSLVTAKLFDRLIANVKGKLVSKIQEIRRKHKRSLLMSEDVVIRLDRGWEVPSSKSSEVYVVNETDTGPHCKCALVCTDCNVCIHRYSCTCIDYSIKLNMCKHIHTVCQIVGRNESHSQNLQDELITEEDSSLVGEKEAILAELSGNGTGKKEMSLSEEKQRLLSIFSKIVHDMTGTEISLAKKMLLTLKTNVRALRTRGTTFLRKSERDLKRKLVPQRHLFSTRKKRKSRNIPLTVPDPEETQQLLRSLHHEGLSTECVTEEQAVVHFHQTDVQDSIPGLNTESVTEEQVVVHFRQTHVQHSIPEISTDNFVFMDHSYAMASVTANTSDPNMLPQGESSNIDKPSEHFSIRTETNPASIKVASSTLGHAVQTKLKSGELDESSQVLQCQPELHLTLKQSSSRQDQDVFPQWGGRKIYVHSHHLQIGNESHQASVKPASNTLDRIVQIPMKRGKLYGSSHILQCQTESKSALKQSSSRQGQDVLPQWGRRKIHVPSHYLQIGNESHQASVKLASNTLVQPQDKSGKLSKSSRLSQFPIESLSALIKQTDSRQDQELYRISDDPSHWLQVEKQGSSRLIQCGLPQVEYGKDLDSDSGSIPDSS